jgi:hypothetical protein
VTRFKWHTLDKRERDPGWADERPEKEGPVIRPASPFSTARGGRLRRKGSRIVWQDGGSANSPASPTKKRSGKKSRNRKSGATTPFDRFSLAVHDSLFPKSKAAQKRKKNRRAKKVAAAQAQGRKLSQTPGEKAAAARARKKAHRRERSPAKSGPGAPRHHRAQRPIPGAPHGQTSQPEPLPVGIPRMTVQQATISWADRKRVATWKIICSDQSGAVVRRTRVASRQTSVVLGGLRSAKRPLSFVVRGYSADGQLVCEGSVGGKSFEPGG